MSLSVRRRACQRRIHQDHQLLQKKAMLQWRRPTSPHPSLLLEIRFENLLRCCLTSSLSVHTLGYPRNVVDFKLLMEPSKSLTRLTPFQGMQTTRVVSAGQRTGWWCAASSPRVNAASSDDGCGGRRRRSTRQAKRLIKTRLALGSYGTKVPIP